MTYRDNVDLAATALVRGEDANWELARLTFENTWNQGEPRSTDRVPMAQWCADVIEQAPGRRFSEVTGLRYKRLWRRWGTLSIDERVPWIEAIARDVGVTLDELREDYGPRKEPASPLSYDELSTHVLKAPPEHREYLFRQLAGDHEIAEQAAEIGSPVSRAVAGLEQKAEILRERQREQLVQSDPVATRLEQQAAVVDIAGECNRFRVDCRRFAQTIAGLLAVAGAANEGDLFWIREALGDARAAMDQLERFMDTGQTDLDAFLENVLAGA